MNISVIGLRSLPFFEGVNLVTHYTIQHVVRFFTMLFNEKGLLASTVTHYSAALSVPLRTALNIDDFDPAVSGMLRILSLRLLSSPLTTPSLEFTKNSGLSGGVTCTHRL